MFVHEVAAAVQISEVEAKLLSLAMEYWEQSMPRQPFSMAWAI